MSWPTFAEAPEDHETATARRGALDGFIAEVIEDHTLEHMIDPDVVADATLVRITAQNPTGAAQLAESTLVCGSWQSEPGCRPQRNDQRKSSRYLQPQSERKRKITRGAERVELTRRRWCVAQQDRAAKSTHAGPNRCERRYGGMA